jgi:hypothetical protein
MNYLFKLWKALIKEAGSAYAETYGIPSDQLDCFPHMRIIHEALASLIMMMEEDVYTTTTHTSCTWTLKAPSMGLNTE